MIFKIEKAQCLLDNGTTITLPQATLGDINQEDVELYRATLKNRVEAGLEVLNIKVENIFLVYKECE